MDEGVGTRQAQQSTRANTATCDDTDAQRLTLLGAYPPQAQRVRATQHSRQAPSPLTHRAESTRKVTGGEHTRGHQLPNGTHTPPHCWCTARRTWRGRQGESLEPATPPSLPQSREDAPAATGRGPRSRRQGGAARRSKLVAGSAEAAPHRNHPPPRQEGLWGAQIAVLSGKAR